MIEPLISIIIPVYNLENYITKTLDSVFAQTYKNIEVIAVNDGSKDNSANVLNEYAKKESRLLVFHKENGGVTSARLKGIELSHGEYIGFVDGDDLIDSDMYERLLNNALRYNADISHCGYRLITEENIEYFYNKGDLILQDNKKGLSDLLEGSRIEPGLWNKLFRKHLFHSLLHGTTIMDFSLKENEDLLMNFCLFEQAEKSVFEDFCPYQYIIRNTSASHGKIKRHILLDPIEIGEILIDHNKNNDDLLLLSSRYYVVKLIKAATYDYTDYPEFVDIKDMSMKRLKAFTKTYIKINSESRKRKLLCVFAAYFPGLYRFIHKLYLK